MNNKGIILTIDALIAVIAVITILIIALFYLGQSEAPSRSIQDLSKIGMGSLSALETKGDLANGVVNIQTFLDNILQDNLCGNITLYDASNIFLDSAQKSGCDTNNEVAITWRTFVDSGNLYSAKMEVWYK